MRPRAHEEKNNKWDSWDLILEGGKPKTEIVKEAVPAPMFASTCTCEVPMAMCARPGGHNSSPQNVLAEFLGNHLNFILAHPKPGVSGRSRTGFRRDGDMHS